MSWSFKLPQYLLILNALLSFSMAYFVWRRHHATGNKPLFLLLLATGFWSLLAALENAVIGIQDKILFAQLEYLSIPIVSPLYFLFAIYYCNLEKHLNFKRIIFLWIIPIITIIAAFTNPYHNLLWYGFKPVPEYNELEFLHGFWFWIHSAYSYLLLLTGTVLILWTIFQNQYLQQLHIAWILTAAVMPWLGNAIYLTGLVPIPGFDITPFAFFLTGSLLAIAINKLKFLDLLPVARSKIIETLYDAIFVLDDKYRIVDINAAAKKIIGKSKQDIIGKQGQAILEKCFITDTGFSFITTHDVQKVQAKGNDNRWYKINLSKIRTPSDRILFSIITVSDITADKLYEDKLQNQADALKAIAEISLTISKIFDIDQIFKEVLRFAYFKFDLYHASILLIDQAKKTIRMHGSYDQHGWKNLTKHNLPPIIQKSVIDEASNLKHGIIINNIANNLSTFPIIKLSETKSVMILPLISSDKFIGIMELHCQKIDRFNDQDLNIATMLASQVSSSEQNCEYIEEHKRYLELIQARQEQLGIAMKLAKLGNFEYNHNNQTIFISKEFIELTPKLKNKSCQKQIYNVIEFLNLILPPEDITDLWDSITSIVNSKKQDYFEYEYRYKKGSGDRFFIIRSTIYRDLKGKLESIKGTIQDITATKESQAELETLVAIIEQASETIMLTDLNGNIVYVNQHFESSTGYSRDEVIGKNPRFLQSGYQDKEFYAQFWEKISYGSTWNGSIINRRKNGQLFHESATIFPIRNLNGEIVYYGAVKRDITEQVKSQNALNEQTKTLQKREIFLSLLNDITSAAIEISNFHELSNVLVKKMGELTNADNCYFFFFDETNRKLRYTSSYNSRLGKHHKQTENIDPLITQILHSGKTKIIRNEENEPYKELAKNLKGNTILGLPLIANMQELGVIFAVFDEAHFFPVEEINNGEQAARQIALAIANSRTIDSAQKRAREAETLRLAGSAVATTLRQDETIKRILEQLNNVVPYDSASVQLLHDDVLEIVGGRGFDNLSEIIGLKFPISGENPSAIVFETEEPFILDNAPEAYPVFLKEPHKGILAWMGIPLVAQDRIIGIISLDSTKPNAFTQEHSRLALSFADQVAVLLENTLLYEEVHQLAITDPLTELHNRRNFLDLAEKEIIRSRRYHHSLSVMMLDIDHFKIVNDEYGHKVGDLVLKKLAEICQDAMRNNDIIGRYGGEEFIIILPETDKEHAFQAAERLRQTIFTTTIKEKSIKLNITVSIGVYSIDYFEGSHSRVKKDLDILISKADQALYKAKQAGRNRVVQISDQEP